MKSVAMMVLGLLLTVTTLAYASNATTCLNSTLSTSVDVPPVEVASVSLIASGVQDVEVLFDASALVTATGIFGLLVDGVFIKDVRGGVDGVTLPAGTVIRFPVVLHHLHQSPSAGSHTYQVTMRVENPGSTAYVQQRCVTALGLP